VTVAAIVAVAGAAASVAALGGALEALRRIRASARLLEGEIERGKSEFDAVVAREATERAEDLQHTLARVRADSLSALAEEERRIAEERRLEISERERQATGKLHEQLVAAQQAIERRLQNWSGDVAVLQQGLTEEVKRVEARQKQMVAEVEGRIGQDGEALQQQIDDQRALLARVRGELEKAAHEASQSAAAELEQHGAERRRALQELAERLRRREKDLREVVDREGAEATQRIQAALVDVERRNVEQLQRVVQRATTRFSEAASQQFDTTIRGAREEAARRLSRELDLAVERFAREAETVFGDRVNQVTDAATHRVEERLTRLQATLERERTHAIESLDDRAREVEAKLRIRLEEIASDAEARRSVIETRLHDLTRRVEELAARA
jgi:uncharacterized protein YukE